MTNNQTQAAPKSDKKYGWQVLFLWIIIAHTIVYFTKGEDDRLNGFYNLLFYFEGIVLGIMIFRLLRKKKS